MGFEYNSVAQHLSGKPKVASSISGTLTPQINIGVCSRTEKTRRVDQPRNRKGSSLYTFTHRKKDTMAIFLFVSPKFYISECFSYNKKKSVFLKVRPRGKGNEGYHYQTAKLRVEWQ